MLFLSFSSEQKASSEQYYRENPFKRVSEVHTGSSLRCLNLYPVSLLSPAGIFLATCDFSDQNSQFTIAPSRSVTQFSEEGCSLLTMTSSDGSWHAQEFLPNAPHDPVNSCIAHPALGWWQTMEWNDSLLSLLLCLCLQPNLQSPMVWTTIGKSVEKQPFSPQQFGGDFVYVLSIIAKTQPENQCAF